MMEIQANYNRSKFGVDLDETTKKAISKDLALNSYNSINKMIEKMRAREGILDEDDLTHASVDVLRYVMSMLNLWEIPPPAFSDAYESKSIFLDVQHKTYSRLWDGRPVAIVDIDDVLSEFRFCFSNYLRDNFNIEASIESEQYFFVEEILASSKNLNPEKIFESFVRKKGFRRLTLVNDARFFLNTLRQKGYWIQLLTARPMENLNIFYDTYRWLHQTDLTFDRVGFSPEKLRWCMNSEYYDSGAIKLILDDSPKHALEYANHGMSVKVPFKSYNRHIKHENITFYNDFSSLLKVEEKVNEI